MSLADPAKGAVLGAARGREFSLPRGKSAIWFSVLEVIRFPIHPRGARLASGKIQGFGGNPAP